MLYINFGVLTRILRLFRLEKAIFCTQFKNKLKNLYHTSKKICIEPYDTSILCEMYEEIILHGQMLEIRAVNFCKPRISKIQDVFPKPSRRFV